MGIDSDFYPKPYRPRIACDRVDRTLQIGLAQAQWARGAGMGVRFGVEREAGMPTIRLERLLEVLHALGGTLAVEGLTGQDHDGPPCFDHSHSDGLRRLVG